MKIDNIDLILNTIDNGVIIIEQNLKVLYWNMWLETRTNIKKEQIISKNLLEFYPKINYKVLKRKIKTSLILNSPTFYNAETNKPLLEIDQSKITEKIFDSMQESITIVPYDLKNKTVCLYIYDNTRLSEQNHKLEYLMKQLKLKIEENEKKDKKIIEQTQLAIIGEMMGNIAHQWRQPLNSISTSITGLSIKHELNVLKNKDIIYFRDVILKSTKYLSDTIDNFTKFSNSNLYIEKIDVNENIRKTLKILNGTFKNYHITIKTDYSENLNIKASSSELSQVILNILTNSKDLFLSIEEEFRLIKIKTYKKDNSIFIKITDTAGGINESIKTKIFEPYFTTKHQSQGTGLGLYIVHRLVKEVMYGTIEVNNVYTKYKNNKLLGVEFIIILPSYKG